jgi:hypothetical protein
MMKMLKQINNTDYEFIYLNIIIIIIIISAYCPSAELVAHAPNQGEVL